MLNLVTLVGRMKELFDDHIVITITGKRKENTGCDLDIYFSSKHVLDNTREYVKVGDILGVKGGLSVENGLVKVIAEKVTFLTSSHIKEGGENNE